MLHRAVIHDSDQLVEFVIEAQGGSDYAREQVAYGMCAMVMQTAAKLWSQWSAFLPTHASFDDVWTGGMQGLYEAVQRFDPELENAFTSYASWWIRKRVQEVIYDLAGSGAVRAKAFFGAELADVPLAGSRMLALDYHSASDLEFSENWLKTEDTTIIEAFDTQLVADLYRLLGSIDSRMPRIAKMLEDEHPYRVIAAAVGLSEYEVKTLTARARKEIDAAGLH